MIAADYVPTDFHLTYPARAAYVLVRPDDHSSGQLALTRPSTHCYSFIGPLRIEKALPSLRTPEPWGRRVIQERSFADESRGSRQKSERVEH
jgi:hypothetical protein